MSAIPRKISFGTAPKYHNKPTRKVIGGEVIDFPSEREANAYANLVLLERAGRIRELKRQVSFKVEVAGKLVCRYVADFVYEEYLHGEWKRVVADAKGYPTPVYKLKKKLMAACLGIEIREL
jgi:hypothetical protein